jgi:L-ascorbate metabolism protein UlaG (beta-lactamase superfamily)
MGRRQRYQGLRGERVSGSSQFKDGVFVNPTGVTPGLQGKALPLLGELFFGGAERAPRRPLPLMRPHERWATRADSGLRVTWLGHSTALLEIDGHRVLTDPVFGMRASPVSFAGPKRFHPPPATLAELLPLDAVLLSHDHYDHLCRRTMIEIAALGVPVVTALGVGAHLEAFGVAHQNIHELDWGERVELGGLTFHATPSQHFSGRSATDRNRTLWAAWVVEGARHRVFFSGDTGLTPQFQETHARFGRFDLVMLEIGAFHPSWGGIHLGPENALTAFEWLGGGTLLPVHWGTFNLALHAWDEPPETLLTSAARRGLRVITPRLGYPVEPSHVEGPDPWWREAQTSPARLVATREAT